VNRERRRLVTSLAAAALAGPAALRGDEKMLANSPTPSERPTIGTIRWDAFYGTGGVAKAVERSLGPARYHRRAPFFAKIEFENKLSINGDSPEILAREIDYAAQAGVYWAFLNYPWQGDMSRPLRMFLTHPDRERVKFTLMLSNHSLYREWDTFFRKALLDACVMPNFQTVLDGRPIIYTFIPGLGNKPDARVKLQARVAEIREAVEKRTGKNPYLVHFMHGLPQSEWPAIRGLGFDASTKYAQFAGNRMTYAAFHRKIVADWESWARKGYQHIPLLSSGWDNRPRYDNPVPWVKKSEHMLRNHTEEPTPEELAAHCKAGMDFVYRNQAVCEAQSLMMYAWNEHDEGGWLCPTLDPKTGKPDDSRVRAIGKMMKAWRPPQ
jgi:hypothetical protein